MRPRRPWQRCAPPRSAVGWSVARHRGTRGTDHPTGKPGTAWQVEPTAAASSRSSRRTRSPKRPVAAGRPPVRNGDSAGVSPRRSRRPPSKRQRRRCLAVRSNSHYQQPALPAHAQPEAPRGCGPTTGHHRRLRWGVTPTLAAPAFQPARQALPGKSKQQLLPAAGPPGARAARSAPWLRADHLSALAAPLECHRGAPGAGHPAGKAGAASQADPTATASSRCFRRMRSPRLP
jgi:hypothetical protein